MSGVDFLMTFKFSKIGKATFEPVSNLPRGWVIHSTQPITKFEVKPINQASVLSFVVPVFPAKFNFN